MAMLYICLLSYNKKVLAVKSYGGLINTYMVLGSTLTLYHTSILFMCSRVVKMRPQLNQVNVWHTPNFSNFSEYPGIQ